MMCGKCGKISGILFLILGLLYLLADIGVWSFFGLQWYTTLFILVGIMSLGAAHCGSCDAPASGMKKKK